MSLDYDDEYLLYNLLSCLLFIKMALREIQDIANIRGLTRIAYIIGKDEKIYS